MVSSCIENSQLQNVLVYECLPRGDVTHVRGDVTHVRGDVTHVRGDVTHVRDCVYIYTCMRSYLEPMSTMCSNIVL